jgi:hypothetical protein
MGAAFGQLVVFIEAMAFGISFEFDGDIGMLFAIEVTIFL